MRRPRRRHVLLGLCYAVLPLCLLEGWIRGRLGKHAV